MGRGVFKRVIQGQGAANRSNAVRPSTDPAPDEPEKKDGASAPEGNLPRAMPGSHGRVPEIANAAPPILGADAAGESAPSSRPKGDAQKREGASLAVYGDVEVCRLLRIRRRTIAAARTKQTRGVDWDCVGLHAGMTMKWIQEEALRRGIVPDFFGGALKPISPGDGVVSCRMLGTWPNRSRVTAEVVATGEARIATVKSADMMHLYEIFDCRDYGGELVWAAELNSMVY